MPDSPSIPPRPPVPATESSVPLDRASIERVLARAAELQAGTGEPTDGMSPGQLEALGQEVGISAENIRQAIAEERTRVGVPEERGLVAAWFGGSMISASRVVQGTADQVLGLIDGWMQREEGLRPRRRLSDRLTWEARRDFVSSIQAKFNVGGRAYSLTAADEVGATAIAIDPQRVLVRLDADVSHSRQLSAVWTGLVGGVMLVGSAGLVAFTTIVPGASPLIGGVLGVVGTGAGAAIASAVAAAQRHKTTRAQLALEQILDRLERGEIRTPSPSLIDMLVPPRR